MTATTDALILIVDDQADNLDTIMGYLSESDQNYKFSQAMNGEIACKVASKRFPDLIIMDWEMPVMNGYDALISIKSNPLTTDIPIIMATGRSSADDLDKALNAGAADYIRKPIEKQELLARVRTCLSISRFIQEIKAKNEILADLNREKDGMIDVVAHDLKSPLNNIKGFAQLIGLEGELNEKQKECLVRMNGQILLGNHLITDLLDIHSYEHAESKIIKTTLNIKQFTTEWKKDYEHELKRKNQILNIELINESFQLTTDKNILTRILDNLLSNAIKFSENDHSIWLKIWNDDKNISLSLKDEGPGISKDDQSKMFKTFQKLSAKPTAGESSNGLGLSIIKTLIEKLGGTITVKSEIDVGTEFTISLPL